MNRTDENYNNNEMPETVLDALLDDVRAGEPDARVVEEASARVWARLTAAASATTLSPDAIENCAGFQALFPEYRNNSLTASRRMLVEDHLHECVACRRALHAAASPKVVTMPHAPGKAKPAPFWMPSKWAVAAMLMLAFGVGSWRFWEWFGPAPSGSRARVLRADGGVYRLQGNTLTPVSTGAELGEGVVLRTAGGGYAKVQLIDGSDMEVGERAEFSVAATRRDTTVNLNRGQIIVQAAKRSSGHLYVSTGDSRVAVTGTVFSVNRGLAGSRVSVVEGEVHVEHGSAKDVLHAGDQVSTHPSIAATTVPDDIAWSRNFDEYIGLLKGFAQIKNKLSEVHMPGLRYSSRLLDNVPEGTVIFVSLPNLSGAIRDLQRIVKDQANQSPQLSAWLEKQIPQFEKITTQMSQMGDYIGDEVILAAQPGKNFTGVIIAEANRPGLKEYIEGELAKSGANSKALGHASFVTVGNKVFIGEDGPLMEAAQRGGSTFAQSSFGQTISSVYRRGAGLFVAADVQRMMTDNTYHSRGSAFDKVRHVIAEQKQVNGKTEYSAVVSFDGQREGIASWLAAPGAMGSLEFVSPGAQFAAAFVVKQPAQMLQDMIALADGKKFDTTEFEQTFGFTVEQLAGYLGGEVTIAVDGPLVPVPSWKFVGDVRDAAGLQAAIGKMVVAANQKLRAENQPEVPLKEESVNGRTFYSVKSPFQKVPMEIHYTYVDGYLVAGSSRTLLERALRDRAAGVTLSRSQDFRKLLPQESRTSFSGMVYQNAGDLIRMVGEAASSTVKMTPEQQKQADELTAGMNATVICLYGEADRIELASQLEPANLLMKGFASQFFGNPGKVSGPKELPKTLHRR